MLKFGLGVGIEFEKAACANELHTVRVDWLKGRVMGRVRILGLVLFFGIGAGIAGGEQEDKAIEKRWGKAIGQFEDWDGKNSWAADGVLFVGSSSIRMWRTRESFGGLDVINRGFGGSVISDVNYFVDRIVLKYRPRVIVFYAGDNDIAKGKSARIVFEDYRKFVKVVHGELAKTPIIYIGIKPSRSRWGLWAVMAEANSMIRDFCGKDRRLLYFDSAPPLLGDDGKPDAKLFLGDKLHLNEEGYKIWTRLIRPLIDKALKLNAKGRGKSKG